MLKGFFECLQLQEGNKQNDKMTLLIINGAGGVGSIAIPIAKRLLGVRVIATASRPETVEFCKKVGTNHVVE